MANPAFSTRYRLPDGRMAVDVTETKTLAATDIGIVQNVVVADVVCNVPATATVGRWTVRDGGVRESGRPNGAVTGAAHPRVNPDDADTISGFNVTGTAADGKYLTNTGGHPGDEITIQNTAATNGGFAVSAVGDWAREA